MVTALLLDYENVFVKYQKSLEEISAKIEWKSFYPSFFKKRSGVIIVISDDQFRMLDQLPKNNKMEYINKINILSYISIIYDEKKGIIILGKIVLLEPSKIPNKNKSILTPILDALVTYLPNTDWLWSEATDFKSLIAHGFDYPFLTSITPLGDILPEETLCMFRKNEILKKEKLDFNQVYDGVVFTLAKEITCTFTFDICSSTRDYLEKLAVKAGVTINKNGSITQKEVSGGLRIISSKIKSNLVIFTLGLDEKLTEYNKEEEASIIPSLYNFHTHPMAAYKNHRVTVGWPSDDDYSAFLSSVEKHNTIFHVVASIEGIYLISLGAYWAIHWKDLDVSVDFIVKNFNLRGKNLGIDEYVSTVNNILYNKYPIFSLKFSKWKESKIFEVFYPKCSGNCFYSIETFKLYHKFYS